jgi:hypothetical protein
LRKNKHKLKEVTMATTASTHCSDYGMMTCIQCGDLLIAPEWSEYEDERHVLNLWSRKKCGCEFKNEAIMPAGIKPKNDRKVVEAFFPSLMVA